MTNRSEATLATLEVLGDVAEWRLPAARWERVAEIIEAIEAAITSRDVVALETATVNLELMGPVRITRIGSSDERVPIPPRIRERVNRLQHRLTAEQSRHEGAVDRKGNRHDQPHDPR